MSLRTIGSKILYSGFVLGLGGAVFASDIATFCESAGGQVEPMRIQLMTHSGAQNQQRQAAGKAGRETMSRCRSRVEIAGGGGQAR